MPPIHEVRGGRMSGRDVPSPAAPTLPGVAAAGGTAASAVAVGARSPVRPDGQAAPVGPRSSTPVATFAATVGPLARAAELELRLREETLRRERAEARAQHAEALAEVAGSRLALLESRVAAVADERAAETAQRDAVVTALRDGLAEVGAELDALRGLAASADRDATEGLRGKADALRVPGDDRPPVRTRSALDPSVRMEELARGARELLAGGRLEAADEVIRGLEDAAQRLRAQTPPPGQD